MHIIWMHMTQPHRSRNLGSSRAIVHESGVVWSVEDDALVAEDGRTLPRIPARELFWFTWAAFFPGTGVYEVGS
jgi:hypothetical protein